MLSPLTMLTGLSFGAASKNIPNTPSASSPAFPFPLRHVCIQHIFSFNVACIISAFTATSIALHGHILLTMADN